MPSHIWIKYAYALTSISWLIAHGEACTTSDSLVHPKIHRKSIKLGDSGPIASSCTFRKFLKIYKDVLHDMVVDYVYDFAP